MQGHWGYVRYIYIGSAADGSLGYLYILTYFVILILNITNAQKRTQFKANSMQLLIKTVSEDANVFGVTSHSLRRTFITELSNKMISARVIQKLARHSNLSITQLYIETNEKQLLNAVNL